MGLQSRRPGTESSGDCSKARVFELVRQKQIPKLAGLGTQVRIPASALTSTQRT